MSIPRHKAYPEVAAVHDHRLARVHAFQHAPELEHEDPGRLRECAGGKKTWGGAPRFLPGHLRRPNEGRATRPTRAPPYGYIMGS